MKILRIETKEASHQLSNSVKPQSQTSRDMLSSRLTPTEKLLSPEKVQVAQMASVGSQTSKHKSSVNQQLYLKNYLEYQQRFRLRDPRTELKYNVQNKNQLQIKTTLGTKKIAITTSEGQGLILPVGQYKGAEDKIEFATAQLVKAMGEQKKRAKVRAFSTRRSEYTDKTSKCVT